MSIVIIIVLIYFSCRLPGYNAEEEEVPERCILYRYMEIEPPQRQPLPELPDDADTVAEAYEEDNILDQVVVEEVNENIINVNEIVRDMPQNFQREM